MKAELNGENKQTQRDYSSNQGGRGSAWRGRGGRSHGRGDFAGRGYKPGCSNGDFKQDKLKINALSVINLDIMLLSAEVILNALSVKSLGIMLLTVKTRKIRWKQTCHKLKRRKIRLYC